MKKIGLIKRIGLTAVIAFVCLALLITCFTFTAPLTAHADEDDSAAVTPTTVSVGKIADGTALKSNYNYGETVTGVPADATVIAPNGDSVVVENGEFLASQLGVYKIRYASEDGSVTYDFKLSVSLAEEYFLYIEYDGADIPTYIEKGDVINLPKAYVKYYDENNILQDYPDKNYKIEVKDSNGNTYTDSMVLDTKDMSGKVFLTYSARLGTDGTKYLSRTFTINVQSIVNKKGNPTLAVSGISKDASVNRPVTLPIATVSDNNDDNVKVVIEVFEPDGVTKVQNVKVNDDGYAYETKEGDYVIFDNNKSMTFYPTKIGTYKVTYTAYNDFYDENNPSAGGRSSTSESQINVADHVAPVFKNTDSYEYLIPETWGVVVKDENGDDVNDMGGKITFAIPEVVDNLDRMPADEGDDGDDLISIYFRITDADNSKTILTINNILATDSDGKYTPSGDSPVYKEEATFNNASKTFTFDFSQYNKTDVNGNEQAAPGNYTVLYRARDKANNTSSKTYNIELKDVFEDNAKPSTAEVTAPDYLSAADESFTVPYAVYADALDTRPLVEYRIYTDADVENNYVVVKGGEDADLTEKAGYVVFDKDKESRQELKLGNNLYFYVGVTDKVGNFRSNAVDDNKDYINVVTSEDGDAYKKVTAVTKIIGETTSDEEFSYESKIDFKNANGNENIKAGDTVNAGSFVITAANEDMRYYTGFEVAIYDPQGNYVDVTLETLSTVENDGTTKIYVKDIKFNAPVDTADDEVYTMTVRVFDVNGKYEVYAYTLGGVNPSDLNNNQTSAIATIGSSGNVNVKYKLNNAVITGISGSGVYRVVRKISGGIFSVMGNEFTALTTGSYSVQDGYIEESKINDGDFDYATDVNFSGVNKGVYNFNVVDNAKPVIELQSVMPLYAEKDSTVTIPVAIAYTENGMGEIKIDVVDPDGKTVKLEDDNTFAATKDGAYTVTYTATYANGEKNSVPYTINVGDVFAPQFTLSGGTSTTGSKKEGDTFTFKNIVLAEDESSTGVQVRKEIYDPSHELLSSYTVDGSYSGYATKGNNGTEITLSKVGEYTIVYTAKDSVGNEYKITETLTVTSQGSSTATTWTTLSTVLIIVAVVLLAGVIVYVVRFRKVKK